MTDAQIDRAAAEQSGSDLPNKPRLPEVALQRLRLRRLTMDALLLALALVLSIVERWIPLELIVPVPGLKLGLANIVTLFAILRLRPLDALLILGIRSLVMGAILGPTVLLFSFGGGILALLVMWLLSRWEGRVFSVIGLSLAGAAAHNTGQVAVASLVLNEPLLLVTYLPPLLLVSIAAGILTGVAAFPVIRRFKPLPMAPRQPRRPKNKPVSRLLIGLLVAGLVFPGFGVLAGCSQVDYKKYTYEFTGAFDTVIQFIGYAGSKAEFEGWTKAGEARFRELNQYFDSYHDYPGLNNVKTINDQAGLAPVKVAPELLQLITQSVAWHDTISDKTNIALGSAILLWQDYRDAGLADPAAARVPSAEELAAALAHTDLKQIQIDAAAGTVFLADQAMRLDLGAVGKGYATELVTREMIDLGVKSLIINAGGSNVRMIGKPLDDRETWNIGLQNPQALLPDQAVPAGSASTAAAVPDTVCVVHANNTSVVTSGDYQRYYLVDGVAYHHLIDPAERNADPLLPGGDGCR